MASNNNQPRVVDVVDAITAKMQKCSTAGMSTTKSVPALSSTSTGAGTFGFQAKRSKSEKLRKKRPSRVILNKNRTDYYLFPIGSIQHPPGAPKTLPKWTDVASIMIQATTTHRNLDERHSSRLELHTTLSPGTLSSTLVKMKMYAVNPVMGHMISMKQLLQTNVKRRIFSETHAKFVCINLMMALRFLHGHGIFHGSICPRKVVFNDKFYPCLTGFGTADLIDERQSRPRERIEAEYMSPEQLFNEHMMEVTDMYTTACLVYAMIYGKPPHKGNDMPETRRNILDKNFEPPFAPEVISAAGKRFIMKCIRKSDLKRYSILDAKESLPDNITWFAGLNEDKLYKQSLPSPLTGVIKQHATKTQKEHK